MLLHNFAFDNLEVLITDFNIDFNYLEDSFKLRLSQDSLPVGTLLRLSIDLPLMQIEEVVKGKNYMVRVNTSNPVDAGYVKKLIKIGKVLSILNLEFSITKTD